MLLPLSGGEFPLDIDTLSLISKFVRSGGRKRLSTSLMEELALEHGAAANRWTEVKNCALANIKQQKCASS